MRLRFYREKQCKTDPSKFNPVLTSKMLFQVSLLSLLSIVYALPSQKNSTEGCTVQAWVRAPDLEPNKVISGEYRLRANGSDCAITKASLVLRLDEHSSIRYM